MLVFINPNNEERYFKVLNQIQYKTYCFVKIAEECVGEKLGLDFFDSLSFICIQTKIKIFGIYIVHVALLLHYCLNIQWKSLLIMNCMIMIFFPLTLLNFSIHNAGIL